MEVYPENLLFRIKNYVEKNNEKWDEDKHFFYIDCTVKPQKLVFSKWNYKVKKPSLDEIGVITQQPSDGRALSKEIKD